MKRAQHWCVSAQQFSVSANNQMPRQQPRYFIFDLDGTLINSLADLTLTLNLLRAELDLEEMAADQVLAMVGDGATMLVRRALGEEHYQNHHLERFLDLYDEHLLDQTRCYPGIEDLLQRHNPRQMAVVTNKPIRHTRRILTGLGLSGFFAAVIGGDSCPHKKPHPLPVLQALRQLGAITDQAVMIGDHHTDLHAAQGANIATCFCAYGFGQRDGIIPDYEVHAPEELLTLFPGASVD